MASYYYLISSLPALSANGKPLLTYGAFLEMCQTNVSASVFSRLESLSPESDEGAFMKQWQEDYAKFSRELAYRRNLKRGANAAPPAESDPSVAKSVNALLAMDDPLEAERALLAIELERIDELTKMRYFDEHVLFGYALKLKLLERFASFEREAGRKEFGELIKKIQTRMTDGY